MPKPNFVKRPMKKILEQKLKELPNQQDTKKEEEEENKLLEDTYDRFINRGQEKT